MFPLGETVVTMGVNDRMGNDQAFSWFVFEALRRYLQEDWGDTCPEDAKQNDYAVVHGEQILAVYKFDEETTIWIITEWDRSATTILFPHEY